MLGCTHLNYLGPPGNADVAQLVFSLLFCNDMRPRYGTDGEEIWGKGGQKGMVKENHSLHFSGPIPLVK
jgi:hypothetical protein